MRQAKHYANFSVKFFLLLIIVAAVFAYAMFQGGFVSWFLFYSFLPFAVYSVLFGFYPLTAFQVKRELKQRRYTAGEKMTVTIRITRVLPFPLVYVYVEDLLPPELKKQESSGKQVVFPWFKRDITVEYTIDPLQRGRHEFPAIRMKAGDMLGLVEKELSVPIEDEILVYPQYREIHYRQIENKYAHGSVASTVQKMRDTTMAAGVREYVPGDKFSWIDWKATARKNAIMTKEFEQVQTNDVTIMLDRTAGGSPIMFEKSVVFAASAARAVIRQGGRLGFLSIGSERTVMPFNYGKGQEEKIFYHLASVRADSRISFSDLIQQEIGKWPIGSTIMLVTHQLTTDLVQTLENLSYRNHAIYLFLMTGRRELGPEETKRINRLRVQHVIVKVVSSNDFKKVFDEVRQP